MPPSSSAAHVRVGLEALQIRVRIAGRVLGIEPGDEADVPERVGEPVDESAAERVGRKRPVHGVDDVALLRLPGGHFPELLHARGVDLRVLALGERERPLELLGDGAARALAEHGDLGERSRRPAGTWACASRRVATPLSPVRTPSSLLPSRAAARRPGVSVAISTPFSSATLAIHLVSSPRLTMTLPWLSSAGGTNGSRNWPRSLRM